jgi:hypothetical protein
MDYIVNKQDTTKYPDRWAKRIRESSFLTQFDGDGMMDTEDQQEKEFIEKMKDNLAKDLVKSAPEIRTQLRNEERARMEINKSVIYICRNSFFWFRRVQRGDD